MSDSESVDYLQADFDPWTLTVPRLRSILVTHSVQYPATAKKAQLVELFTEQVVPLSKKLLAQRARVKRMSSGIVDAESQETVSSADYDLMPPPPTKRSRSPRKSSRILTDTPEHDGASLPAARSSPRKKSSRSVTGGAPAASDTDTGTEADGPRSARAPRRTPSAKVVSPVDGSSAPFKQSPEGESVFTDDNPFQSGGSSPPVPVRTPSNRRKTTGPEAHSPKASSTHRRRTDGPHIGGQNDDIGAGSTIVVKSSFEAPASKLLGSVKGKKSTVVEAGEEFTPQEQLELAAGQAANPGRALATRQKSQSPARRFNLMIPFWVLVMTLLSAYAAWYRQEKVAVGYCGLGRSPTQVLPPNIEIPGWAEPLRVLIEPQCEPCPPHAYCYEDFSVRCEPDFVLKQHPLSLGGLVPLPPTCEPDGEKVRRVQVVADKAVEELRNRRAKFECGDLVNEEGEQLDSPAIEEQELKEAISAQRSKKMNDQEFDDLWFAAIGEIKARDEVEVHEEENGDPGAVPTTRLSSTSLARVPFLCAIRRSLVLGLARYRVRIGAVIASLLLGLYGRARYLTHRAAVAQVPALVDLVLERLANQKELAFEGGADDAFLFLPNLRDDVLRSVHSLSRREAIWQRVRSVVEQNSNVRTGQRESQDGEVGRAWEWIGPSSSGAIDGGRRRRSVRVSWGADVKAGDGEDDDFRPLATEMSESKVGLHRRWEESRPIY